MKLSGNKRATNFDTNDALAESKEQQSEGWLSWWKGGWKCTTKGNIALPRQPTTTTTTPT